MNYSKNGLHLTENFEGLRLTAYPDPATHGDPWTIGYGSTKGVHQGMVITQEQAEQRLMDDVQSACDVVNSKVHTDLTQNEFDALVDFVFNVGAGNFAGSTLLKKINAGDMEEAALEFQKWDKAAGHVMAGLVRRRQAETDLFKGLA